MTLPASCVPGVPRYEVRSLNYAFAVSSRHFTFALVLGCIRSVIIGLRAILLMCLLYLSFELKLRMNSSCTWSDRGQHDVSQRILGLHPEPHNPWHDLVATAKRRRIRCLYWELR